MIPNKSSRWIAKHVKAAKIPHIYWATEDPGYHKIFSLPLIRRIKPDFVFTINRPTVAEYEKLSIPAAHLDFGYHKSVHHRTEVFEQYKGSAALVANGYLQLYKKYPEHTRFQHLRMMINPLLAKGYPVHFYGRYWDQMRSFFKPRLPAKMIHGYLDYTEATRCIPRWI